MGSHSSVKNRLPRFSRLATKQFFFVLGGSFIITVLAVSLQVSADYRRELRNVEMVFETIESSYVPAIRLGVFNFNEDQLSLLLEGIILLRPIAYAEIIEERSKGPVMIAAAGKKSDTPSIVRSFPLQYRYEETIRDLGELEVRADVSGIRERVRERFWLIAGSSALLIFAVAIFILIVVQISVVRHLVQIAGFVCEIDFLRDQAPVLSLRRSHSRRNDELDDIVSAIITTNARLKATFQELSEAHENLSSALTEKETLLRELYHRTKNNMQVIISLLRLKAGETPDNAELQELVDEMEDRVQSMALIHQKLYESRDLTRINMAEYFADLTEFLSHSSGKPGSVTLTRRVEECSFLIDAAIPCGLIVTELIANAYKHAFIGHERGNILLELSTDGNSQVELMIQDDGAGFPDGFDLHRDGSMGLRTAITLVEQQLNGTIRYESAGGVLYRIGFSTKVSFDRRQSTTE